MKHHLAFAVMLFAMPASAADIKTIELNIAPSKLPVPAMKWRLLPELRDLSQGNAVTLYYRSFSPEWTTVYRQDPKTMERLSDFLNKPVQQVSKEDRESVQFVRNKFVDEVDRAARRTSCDWELLDRAKEDGFSLLIPDVQGMRAFSSIIAARTRLDIIDGKFPDAARSLQTGFAMARHMNQAPTLIHSLVAAAMAMHQLNQVELWVQTAGSPNLTWALVDLPNPFIDLRVSLQGEKLMVDSMFPGGRELLSDPSRPEPGEAIVRGWKQTFLKFAELEKGFSGLHLTLGFLIRIKPAKEHLSKLGFTAEKLDKMNPEAIVLLSELADYDEVLDELVKLTNLPFATKRSMETHLSEMVGKLRAGSLASAVLPATQKIVESAVRVDRRIAALRVVEAIRAYAAKHNKLPESLPALNELPIPADPVTGSPFDYKLEAGAATLTAVPFGEAANQQNSFRYVIRIK